MQRPKVDNADWHVTARGARRLLLFHDDSDYSAFYSFLGESCQHSGLDLIAECLMSNHFHLSLSGSTASLSHCMQRLNRGYSTYHNERYGLSGHAFDQVFYGEPIPSDFLLKRVVRYIHMNPVRGGKTSRPEQYSWSSYRRLTCADTTALSRGERRVLHLFDPDLRIAQEAYRAFTEKDLGRRTVSPVGRAPAWEIWDAQFGWILDHTLEHDAFLAPLDPEGVAVYLGSRIGIPPRAMGRHLGHSDGRRASEMIRALKRRLSRAPSLEGRIESLSVL